MKAVKLSKDGKKYYEEIYAVIRDDMEDGDEILLTILVNSIITYNKANEVLEDRGPVLAGDTMVRANPAFQIVKESEKMIESLATHFGLSPKSRKVSFKTKDDSGEDIISNFKSQYKSS